MPLFLRLRFAVAAVFLLAMRKFLIVITLMITAAVSKAGDDGSTWQIMGQTQKFAWIAGWKNGVCMASNIGHTDTIVDAPTNQIVQGLDQFYASDYRNLTVPLQVSALVIVRYAHGDMTKQQVYQSIDAFRAH